MARSYGRRPRGGTSKTHVDPAISLRNETVKLFDKGDGHGADWVEAAIASFRVAFYCLQNIPDDHPDRAAIAQRAHDFAYGLMVGTPDSGAPFATGGAKPQRVVFSMTDPALGRDHDPSR